MTEIRPITRTEDFMFTFETLLAPLSVDAFLNDYWPDLPVHIPGDPSKTAALRKQVAALGDVEELLANYPDRVSLLRPDGFYAAVPTGAAALPFYRAEYTAFVRRIDRNIAELSDLAAIVADALSVPHSSLGCDLFMSSGNETSTATNISGLAMHSDAEVSFALLLEGEKRWCWAPNTHIQNQTTTVTRDGDRQVDPDELLLADQLPIPSSMPKDAEHIQARPGDLIFLPRGWWHTTHAVGNCAQLNFTMDGPMLLEVVTEVLAAELLTRNALGSGSLTVCE